MIAYSSIRIDRITNNDQNMYKIICKLILTQKYEDDIISMQNQIWGCRIFDLLTHKYLANACTGY